MDSVELMDSHRAYCLQQMGVQRWVSKDTHEAFLSVYRPTAPWEGVSPDMESAIVDAEAKGTAGFQPVPAITKVDKDSLSRTVAGLREQLDAEPEVIVEDLQPIEEKAVAIEPVAVEQQISIDRLRLMAYQIGADLLILTELPPSFTQESDIEAMALKMSSALLKTSIEEWSSAEFKWPGGLTNPHFRQRMDWLSGALQSFIDHRTTNDNLPALVIAGQRLEMVWQNLPEAWRERYQHQVCIPSLPELYRLPELKREAWARMQTLR